MRGGATRLTRMASRMRLLGLPVLLDWCCRAVSVLQLLPGLRACCCCGRAVAVLELRCG